MRLDSTFNDYPWGPIRDALETTVGRVVIFFVILLISLSLGTALAFKSFAGLLAGIVGAHWILIGGLFYSLGIVVFPAVLMYAILYTRYEWPLWTLVIPALAFIYISYDSTDYSLNRSPAAKLQKQLDEVVESAVKEINEKREWRNKKK